MLKDGKIYDFQPVRDLSLYIDIQIDELLDWGHTGTITNLLIFYGTIFMLWKIFFHFFEEKKAFLLCAIFFSHPLYFLIYIEITQRKHILSFLFILATYLMLLKRRNNIGFLKAYFFYFLAVLSHPINALLPAWFFYQEKERFHKKTILSYVPFAVIFLAIYFTNAYLYRTIHMPREGMNFSDLPFVPYHIIYSIGLHFRQFFFPISFGNFYSLGNLSVLIFSYAPLVFGFLAYKFVRKQFLFFMIPLIIIFLTLYGHKSNVLTIFLQNTYVLTPSFIFLFFLGFMIKKQKRTIFFLPIPLILQFISFSYSSHRVDPITFYEYTFPKEPECRSLQTLVYNYIKKGYVEKMKIRGKEWLDQKCLLRSSSINFMRPFVNTHLIFESEEFPYEEKLYLFKNKYETKNDTLPLELVLKIEYEKDEEDIKKLYQEFNDVKYASFFTHHSYLGKIIVDSCEKYGEKSCKSVKTYLERTKSASIINRYFENIPSYEDEGSIETN